MYGWRFPTVVIDDDSVFRIKAFAIPRVRIGDIADQCEPFHFIGRERVEVDQRNDKNTTGTLDDHYESRLCFRGIYTGEWNGFKILLSGYRFQNL